MPQSDELKLTRKQKTLAKESVFSGIGIHTGQCVQMNFYPAEPGRGIVFRRTDMPGAPELPATVEYVRDTARSTTLGVGNVRIHTVEHVLAALKAYQIDNLVIELSNLEPPVADGGSLPFVEMIEEAGIVEQDADIPIFRVKSPIYYSDGDVHLVALPCNSFKISYTLNYPKTPVLCSQFQSFTITPETFKKELAPCRTFSLYEEVSALMDRGLIKGGSLDNAVIIKDEVIFSKGGLRFPDEMVRHKILDMVGDLSLVGYDFYAHLIAIRSGHGANYEFSKRLLNSFNEEGACQKL